MIVVTAASKRYFGALINLVGSLHYWESDHQITVYDLGLGTRQLEEMNRWRNVSVKERFLDMGIPPHCRNLYQYAWKPYAIADSLQTHDRVLWIDAGSDIRAPLKSIDDFLSKEGYFLTQGQDLDMTLMSHSATYEFLGFNKNDFLGKPHYSANLQGYLIEGLATERILTPMLKAASVKDCIAPPGSNLSNHRFDQTILSIFAYSSGMNLNPQTELLACSRAQLQQDHELPSNMIVYTARGRSDDYKFYVRDTQGDLLYKKYFNPGI